MVTTIQFITGRRGLSPAQQRAVKETAIALGGKVKAAGPGFLFLQIPQNVPQTQLRQLLLSRAEVRIRELARQRARAAPPPTPEEEAARASLIARGRFTPLEPPISRLRIPRREGALGIFTAAPPRVVPKPLREPRRAEGEPIMISETQFALPPAFDVPFGTVGFITPQERERILTRRIIERQPTEVVTFVPRQIERGLEVIGFEEAFAEAPVGRGIVRGLVLTLPSVPAAAFTDPAIQIEATFEAIRKEPIVTFSEIAAGAAVLGIAGRGVSAAIARRGITTAVEVGEIRKIAAQPEARILTPEGRAVTLRPSELIRSRVIVESRGKRIPAELETVIPITRRLPRIGVTQAQIQQQQKTLGVITRTTFQIEEASRRQGTLAGTSGALRVLDKNLKIVTEAGFKTISRNLEKFQTSVAEVFPRRGRPAAIAAIIFKRRPPPIRFFKRGVLEEIPPSQVAPEVAAASQAISREIAKGFPTPRPRITPPVRDIGIRIRADLLQEMFAPPIEEQEFIVTPRTFQQIAQKPVLEPALTFAKLQQRLGRITQRDLVGGRQADAFRTGVGQTLGIGTRSLQRQLNVQQQRLDQRQKLATRVTTRAFGFPTVTGAFRPVAFFPFFPEDEKKRRKRERDLETRFGLRRFRIPTARELFGL